MTFFSVSAAVEVLQLIIISFRCWELTRVPNKVASRDGVYWRLNPPGLKLLLLKTVTFSCSIYSAVISIYLKKTWKREDIGPRCMYLRTIIIIIQHEPMLVFTRTVPESSAGSGRQDHVWSPPAAFHDGVFKFNGSSVQWSGQAAIL